MQNYDKKTAHIKIPKVTAQEEVQFMNTAASMPITENEHFKEVIGIMQENNKNDVSLNALFKYVDSLENQLQKS